jgi:hypothetical protein
MKMDKISKDSSYGLKKIIWPIINEFQKLLEENKNHEEWNEYKGKRVLNKLFKIIQENETINEYTEKYMTFFEEKTNRNDFSNNDKNKIKFSFIYSLIAHLEDKRKVGGHYFNHPNSVAIESAKAKWDIETIVGSFIHDTTEDRVKKFKSDENKDIINETKSINPRELYIQDYLVTRKRILKNNQKQIKEEVKPILDNILKEYSNCDKKTRNAIENIFIKEKEYGIERIIRKLSKSSRQDYERYDEDIFKYETYDELIKINKRHNKTNRTLNKIEKFLKGIKEKVKENLEKIIISNANKAIAIKIEDRINNIATLDVVEYNVDEIINGSKGLKKIVYTTIMNFSLLKRKFTDYAATNNQELENHISKNKEIGYFRNFIRNLGHGLNKRKFISPIITEENYINSWGKYFLDLVKGKKAEPPIYSAMSHEKKINEYWKNIILIENLNIYLDSYENKDDEEYKRLEERTKVLYNITLNRINKDITHTKKWHISIRDLMKWNKEIKEYEEIDGFSKKTNFSENNYFDGLTYVLDMNINKKSDYDIKEEKAKEIKKLLKNNRGYQYAALNGLQRYLENSYSHLNK